MTIAAEYGRPESERIARIARRVRLLIPHASGDVRAELEELRAELEALAGPAAEVIAISSRRTKA